MKLLRALRLLTNAVANILDVVADTLDFFTPSPPRRRYKPDTRSVEETLRADARAVNADGAKSRGRVVHYDVSDREFTAVAFCTLTECNYGRSTDEWLWVTCPDCHKQRAPEKAPLSHEERMTERRATGPGTSRPLSKEEMEEDYRAMRAQGWGKDWYRR